MAKCVIQHSLDRVSLFLAVALEDCRAITCGHHPKVIIITEKWNPDIEIS
ncbi:unnamed protein product [Arabidopsis halleri]